MNSKNKERAFICKEHPPHWNKKGFVPTQADYEALECVDVTKELFGVFKCEVESK